MSTLTIDEYKLVEIPRGDYSYQVSNQFIKVFSMENILWDRCYLGNHNTYKYNKCPE